MILKMEKKFKFANAGKLFPSKISKKCYHDFRTIYIENKNSMTKKDQKEFNKLINNMTRSQENDCYEFLVRRTGNNVELINFCD